MAEERVRRRLAAILAADVVGYSRLIERDEQGTRARVRRLLDERFAPLVAAGDGRVVKTMGDGVLAEFPSAVDAVRSAIAIQDAVAAAESDAGPDDRIVLRMGINVGDVIVEGDDIHGEGVNLAARLESICEPGRILVSGSVFEQVASKLDAAFDDLGAKSVKNIERQVRVYRVRRQSDPAAARRASEAAPALPSKPSIAVLPFENLSGDPDQDYFSDGVTEDIIAALSRVRQFFVIARNTTFSYKGKATDAKAVADALGVRYILEGSVRRAGNRVRISAQLVNGANGVQLWADRYDRELDDIFELQDEITRTVVGAMAPELDRAEQERVRLMPTENMDAWDLYQRGRWHFNRIDQDGLVEAEALFREAIALDPDLCCAHAALSAVHFYAYILTFSSDQGRIAAAVEAARRAVEIDPSDPSALVALGRAVHLEGNHVDAITHMESAIALDPSHAQGHYILATALAFSGRAADGIAHFETAMRLSPRDPWTAHFMSRLSEAHLYAGHLAEAAHWGQEARRQPGPWAWTARLGLAAALGHLGRKDEAGAVVGEMRSKLPDITLSFVRERFSIVQAPYLDVLIDGLSKAGLTDTDAAPMRADKPSIAVLPFTNMSGDPEQEYFADGITEDLITDLSKISGLFVVARNSTFSYKGKQTDVRGVAEDLGVAHVLEGSVRRAGEKVRINAQLIDAQSGGHVWAERYDRDFQDIFALQDEITAEIVAALEVTLTSRDRARVNRKPTESTEAYEHLLRGRAEYYRYNPESLASAIDHLESAIALDPGFAEAYGYLSYCYFMRFVGMWPGADADLTPALRLAEKGVALDPDSAVALTRLAWVQGFTRRFDESLPNFEKAISLDPNNAETYAAYAEVLTHYGDADRSLEMNARAVAIDTVAPPSWEYHFGNAYMVLGRHDEAIAKMRRALELVPKFLPAHLRLACAYAEAGRLDEARQTIKTVLELAPDMSIAHWDRIAPHRTDEQRRRFRVALRKAGLPE